MRSSPKDELTLVVGLTACEFVYIPAGVFLMGTDAERASSVAYEFPGVQAEWILKETPMHEVYLSGYYISRTPITNQLWAEYVKRTYPLPPVGWNLSREEGKHPVTGITYEEAQAFCRWLSRVSGYRIELPSEAQWEKAARGTDAREWPWGNEFSTEICNTREGGYGGTTAIDRFPAGDSPYGVLDMGGNVEKWTMGLYQPYPCLQSFSPAHGF